MGGEAWYVACADRGGFFSGPLEDLDAGFVLLFRDIGFYLAWAGKPLGPLSTGEGDGRQGALRRGCDSHPQRSMACRTAVEGWEVPGSWLCFEMELMGFAMPLVCLPCTAR